jgi:hypothetical protein
VRAIGVDVTEGLVYEGGRERGIGVLPTPMLFVATLLGRDISTDAIPEEDNLDLAELLFREDSFDAVSRLRRGRLYERGEGSQPHQWHVRPHPGTTHVGAHVTTSGIYPHVLHGFRAFSARLRLSSGAQPSILVFGTRSAYSLWRVVDIERTVTGEDLVTLRARSSLGLLPELLESSVPADALPKVKEVLETLAQSAHTSAPSSVIDRARDVALTCIGAWLAEKKGDRVLRTKELGVLADGADEEKHVITASVARSIARLHASAKPNEQERRAARPPMEADAEYALAAIGLMLRDIRWAL